MIHQSAGEEGSNSGVLNVDVGKPMVSGTYPGEEDEEEEQEEISQESCRRPKPAQMRSIEDDLLGRLEQVLDPRIERGGGDLLPNPHGGGGAEGQAKDQGKDQDDDGVMDTADLNKGIIGMDKNLDMNLEMGMENNHRRGTAGGGGSGGGGKATPEARRKVTSRRREKTGVRT